MVTREQHCLYTCSIVVMMRARTLHGVGSLMRVTVDYPKGLVEETVRVFTVQTFDIAQQLVGGQNPDGADCDRCSRTNTIWQARKCSRVTSRGLAWPCQRGYLLDEVVTPAPGEREVRGST